MRECLQPGSTVAIVYNVLPNVSSYLLAQAACLHSVHCQPVPSSLSDLVRPYHYKYFSFFLEQACDLYIVDPYKVSILLITNNIS